MPDQLRVLYVDDEPGLLEIGKLFLEESRDFSVTTIDSATAALDLLLQEKFDAIISDYQMPEMDGIQFLIEVREKFGAIPFILFTGKGREEVVIQAINNGADFYLQKGGDPTAQFAELSHKVRQAVQQNRASVRIRDHERREADIINFLPDATFAIDTHGVVIAWNHAMEEMTGVRMADMLGKGNYEYSIPIYHEHRPILIDLVLTDDPAIAAKYPYMKREGRTLFAEATSPHLYNGRGAAIWFTAAPLYNNKGEVVGAIESIRDITERKRAEEVLTESRHQLGEAMDLARLVNWEFDVGTGIFTFDDRFYALFGTTAVQEGGYQMTAETYAREFLHPDDQHLVADEVKKDIETTDPHYQSTIEHRIIRRNGEVRYVQVRIGITKDAQGRTIKTHGTNQDITDLKRAEEGLRESHDRFEATIASLDDAVFLVDPATLLIIECNDATTRIFGYSYEELVGRGTGFLHVDQAHLEQFGREARATYEDPGYYRREFQMRRKDGCVFPTEHFVRPIYEPDGRILYVVSVVRDITGRKQAEDALRESEEKYRSILENIQDVYYRSDTAGNFLMVSPSILPMIGYDRVPELLGKNIAQTIYYHPEERSKFLDELDNRGTVTDYEVTLKKRNGMPVYVSTSSHKYFDHSGNYLGVEGVFRDITQRKQFEEALQKSEEKYRRIVETANEGVWVVDQDMNTTFVNQRFADMIGYSREEMVGHNVMDYVINDDKASAETQFIARRNGIEGRYECKLRHRDGRVVWCLISGSPLTDDTGSFKGSLGMIMDITERKRAEDALQESEARYRLISENTADVIWTLDYKTGKFTYVSPSVQKLRGYTPDEVLNQTMAEALTTDSMEAVARLLQKRISERKPGDTSRIITTNLVDQPCKGGSVVSTEVVSTIVFDVQGHPVEIIGISRNITERKRAEEALRESEKSYRGLFNTIRQAIYILNPDGTFVDVNEGAEAMYGYAREEFIGRTAEFLSAPEKNDLAAVMESIRKAFAGESQLFEFWGLRKGGEIFPKDVYLYKGTYFGKDVIVAVGADITERKRAEELVSESENKFASVFNGSPVALTLVSAIDGKFVNVNDAFVRATGYSRNEAVGKTSEALGIFADDNERNILASSLQNHHIVEDMEIRCRVKTGEIRPCLFSSGIILIDRKPYILSTVRDITVRKQMEEALKESEEKYRDIFENSVMGLFQTAPSGRMINVNNALARMYGFSDAAEMLAADLDVGNHPYANPEDQQAVRNILAEKGNVENYEAPHLKWDGTRFWVSITARIKRDTEGNVLLYEGTVIDITERKLAEVALKQAKERLLRATVAGGVGIWDLEVLNNKLTWDDQMFRLYGITPDNFGGAYETWKTRVHPEDVAHGDAEVQMALRGEKEFDTEFRVVWPDGTIHTIRGLANVERDASGKAIRLIGTNYDITERKRAEEALRNSEGRLHTLVQTIPDLIWLKDKDGVFLSCNTMFERLFGARESEIVGKTDYDFVDKELADFFREQDRKAVMAGKPTSNEEWVTFADDGHRALLDTIKTPMYDAKGTFTGVLGIGRDITNRKREEDTIKTLTTHLLNAQKIAHIGSFDFNIPENKVMWSDEMFRVFGLEPQASPLTIEQVSEMIYPDDRVLHREQTEKIMETGSYEFEHRLVWPDGNIRWIAGRAEMVEYDAAGAPVRMLGTMQDITERKLLDDTRAFLVQCGYPGSGEDFFNALARFLAERLDMSYVCIDTLEGDGLTAGTVAIYNDGKFETNVTYALKDTPCGDVVGKTICCFPTEVCRLFPHDAALRDLKAESYVGTTLWSSEHTPIGLIALIGQKPLKNPTLVELVLQLVAVRAAGEMERRRAEEALRESEGILQDIIEKNPLSIQIVDREGFTLKVNPAFIRLFGSVPPPDFSIIMDLAKSRPELENHISRVKNGEPVNLPDMSFNPHDIYPELPDVPTRVRAIIFPLNDRHGKPQRFIFMHEDITEQRRAEEALRQSNRKLTLLSGITRHDINNQITVLVGYLRMLEKKQPDTIHNEYFQKIATAAQRISSMIQFTREYESIGVKAPAWQDARTLVDTAAKQAPLGTIIVQNDLPIGAEVFADPLVVKVFYNLTDNAVRYGGKITTIRFSAEERGDDKVLVCEDDGEGIPVEEKEKIFERGFGKNTGLGLALSREILDITGMKIKETGEPGKGARFEMVVPKGMWQFK